MMPVNVQRLRRPRLPLLGTLKVRVAQLHSGYPFDGAEVFAPERWSQIQRYAPHVLVGSSADLQRLVERIDLRTVRIETLDHSIFVVTEIGDKPLTDVLRAALWQRFGVPVFEVYTDGVGNVLAYECEAHSGWHVDSGCRFAVYQGELLLQKTSETAVRTGLSRHLESETCVCGRAGVRIIQTYADRQASADGAQTSDGGVSVREPILAAIA